MGLLDGILAVFRVEHALASLAGLRGKRKGMGQGRGQGASKQGFSRQQRAPVGLLSALAKMCTLA